MVNKQQHSLRPFIFRIYKYTILFSVVFLNLMSLTGGKHSKIGVLLGFLSIAPFLVIISIFFVNEARSARKETFKFVFNRRIALLIIFYLFLQTVMIMRGYYVGLLDLKWMIYYVALLVLVSFFCIAIFWHKYNQKYLHIMIPCVYLSPTVYVIVNIILYSFGIHKRLDDMFVFVGESHRAIMLSILGVEMERVHFALSGGFNSFGLISGSSLLVGLMMLSDYKKDLKEGAICILAILAGIIGILATDSRGTLFFSIITFMIVKFGLRWGPIFLRWLLLIIPFSAILVVQVVILVSSFGGLDYISRNPGSVTTISSRTLIWGLAFDRLKNFDVKHIFGYGWMGQYTSGLSFDLLDVGVKYWERWKQVSTHNIYLQQIFDIGYLGLITFFILTLSTASIIITSHKKAPYLRADRLLGILYLYLLNGATEAIIHPKNESFVVFVFLLMITASLKVSAYRSDSHTVYN